MSFVLSLIFRFLLFQLVTPANTPATPPNFPDAMAAFSKLQTSDTSPKTQTLNVNVNHQRVRWCSNAMLLSSCTVHLCLYSSAVPFFSAALLEPFYKNVLTEQNKIWGFAGNSKLRVKIWKGEKCFGVHRSAWIVPACVRHYNSTEFNCLNGSIDDNERSRWDFEKTEKIHLKQIEHFV